ncbi:hypothetical protein MA16_Dca011595 [Dendrobium catenatum]|uniref:Uncharacterized protein n=1 Tax=Dendrobium catenatum TaxID=906689 RepID=A0A2I0WQN0_9ASPA|nr:hypothetical protein MA16_Dca011595 [Dendrobium catenatum]
MRETTSTEKGEVSTWREGCAVKKGKKIKERHEKGARIESEENKSRALNNSLLFGLLKYVSIKQGLLQSVLPISSITSATKASAPSDL